MVVRNLISKIIQVNTTLEIYAVKLLVQRIIQRYEKKVRELELDLTLVKRIMVFFQIKKKKNLFVFPGSLYEEDCAQESNDKSCRKCQGGEFRCRGRIQYSDVGGFFPLLNPH